MAHAVHALELDGDDLRQDVRVEIPDDIAPLDDVVVALEPAPGALEDVRVWMVVRVQDLTISCGHVHGGVQVLGFDSPPPRAAAGARCACQPLELGLGQHRGAVVARILGGPPPEWIREEYQRLGMMSCSFGVGDD
jgi:hypothetical protein